jgi:hypothetical protein
MVTRTSGVSMARSGGAPCQTTPHRQAGLDCGIAVVGLSAALAGRRGMPGHGGIEPERKRAAALQRFIVGWPVPGLGGGECGSAHATQLPRWVHNMNPSRDLCNRAVYRSHCPLGHLWRAVAAPNPRRAPARRARCRDCTPYRLRQSPGAQARDPVLDPRPRTHRRRADPHLPARNRHPRQKAGRKSRRPCPAQPRVRSMEGKVIHQRRAKAPA